jgi:hydroxymethylpyrimidine/phosphomethylpyrimidine kinase
MSVITAVTAQNTMAVRGIHPIPPEYIGLQLDAVLSDIGTDAVKIGMLHSSPVISIVADRLRRYPGGAIVLDPVMAASSGDRLLAEQAVDTLKAELLPLAALVTPNLPEASILLGRDVTSREQMADACRELVRLGCRSVYLKGGHLTGGSCVDMLFDGSTGKVLELAGERLVTRNTHGTGCTVSSAITAGLAKGMALAAAVDLAKRYVSHALRTGAEIITGHGHGPVHHFHAWWQP